jgi:hypothetical protein
VLAVQIEAVLAVQEATNADPQHAQFDAVAILRAQHAQFDAVPVLRARFAVLENECITTALALTERDARIAALEGAALTAVGAMNAREARIAALEGDCIAAALALTERKARIAALEGDALTAVVTHAQAIDQAARNNVAQAEAHATELQALARKHRDDRIADFKSLEKRIAEVRDVSKGLAAFCMLGGLSLENPWGAASCAPPFPSLAGIVYISLQVWVDEPKNRTTNAAST